MGIISDLVLTKKGSSSVSIIQVELVYRRVHSFILRSVGEVFVRGIAGVSSVMGFWNCRNWVVGSWCLLVSEQSLRHLDYGSCINRSFSIPLPTIEKVSLRLAGRL